MRKLGARQEGCLDGLRQFGQWNDRYCRWSWSGVAQTKAIMESLVKRGLVSRTEEDGVSTYRLTDES